MPTDDSILSFLPLQYQQSTIRLGTDNAGRLVCIAADVVKPLGYRDAPAALRMLDPDEQGYTHVRTAGGPQRMLYVTESGFYHLIFGSRREEARAFRRWVTEDILPALRQTGRYSIPGPIASAATKVQRTCRSLLASRRHLDSAAR